jgi:CheY-like chemotaxis protein
MNSKIEKNKGEILVVDDTPANLKLLMDMLSSHGYKVRPAADGEQALAAVAMRQPELILLDIKMPGIDGYEVCRRLKSDTKSEEIPVVFISALDTLGDRVKGFELGAVDYITKPFQREEVLVRVHTHLQLSKMRKNLEELVDERTEELREAYQSLQESEAKTRESEKQLRQAVKMEAIGTMAGGIAHDFNNLLSVIVGFGELAQADLPDDHPVQYELEQILKAGKRATELTKQILTFSRQEEGEFKPVYLQSLVKEVLKLLRSSLPSTICIKENISADCGTILADATRIHQVLMNLCINAKHAMEEDGGTLSVSLAQIEVTGSSGIPSHPEIEYGMYLDLTVSDTGCGMSALTMAKIFDPFFTTKEKGRGTGLGLAVVYGIVKTHRGIITVSSELGKGATFHVYLPVITKETEPDQKVREVVSGGSERILIVDDEEIIVEMLQAMLNRLGYKVTVFTSSIKALNGYEENPEAFDLVITDMTMPKMTGIALARKLLEIKPELPIILCTGYSEIVGKEKARSLGIREFIMKPILRNDLAKAIRKALS